MNYYSKKVDDHVVLLRKMIKKITQKITHLRFLNLFKSAILSRFFTSLNITRVTLKRLHALLSSLLQGNSNFMHEFSQKKSQEEQKNSSLKERLLLDAWIRSNICSKDSFFPNRRGSSSSGTRSFHVYIQIQQLFFEVSFCGFSWSVR